MESIGKEMVVQCKGLPLAVSTLGGLLKGKSLGEWESINKDINFYLAKGEAGDNDEYHTVSHVLGLSYDSLSPRLRQCFLCLGNYKEEEIHPQQLYLLWIGEGLISPEDKPQGGTMLELAESYLDELACRSLVQVDRWRYEGWTQSKFEKCRVHDLIQKLCLSKVKEETFTRVIDSRCKPDDEPKARNNRVRRLCFYAYDDMDEPVVDENVVSQIRSLLLFNRRPYLANKIFSLKKFKLLRVLRVQGFKLSAESLRNIGKLVYLKYLSFIGCELKELPSSIGNLRNLEILDLRVRNSVRIPNVLRKLKQLKNLFLPTYQFTKMRFVDNQEKVRLDGLNELELIEGFDTRYCETQDLIGLSKIKSFVANIVVAENPMIIQNTIDCISSKELHFSLLYIASKGEAERVSVVLLLECSYIDALVIDTPIRALPEYDHNRFSRRLTILKLLKCKIEEFDPMIMLEKLPNLLHLSLDDDSYMGREMVCSSGGFRQLKTLFLYRLFNLTKWRVGEGAMPNLYQIHINGCYKLEMLPDGLRFLAALKQLYIQNMPAAFSDRARVIDGVEGQDFYKVTHVPIIVIKDNLC